VEKVKKDRKHKKNFSRRLVKNKDTFQHKFSVNFFFTFYLLTELLIWWKTQRLELMLISMSLMI